jgi:proton glutamate symport protein
VSLTTRVLIGLVAGLTLGIVADATRHPALIAISGGIGPVGTLFINAIRMTVIPLVVASLIGGIGGAPDPRTIGRLGTRALVLFLAFLAAAVAFACLFAPPLMAWMPLGEQAAVAMRAGAFSAGDVAEAATKVPSFGAWLVDLVPANPIKAAADGAMLPLIVFSLLFGLAITRVEAARRTALLSVIHGVADASTVLVGWILATAPIGVFALSVTLGLRLGLSAAGALAWYMATVALLSLGFIALVLYPAAVLGGRVPLGTFARACVPAQAVAMSARSSLAALPAMIQGAASRLGASREITGFFLPLAASTFRVGAGVGQVIAILFIARLYGIDLPAAKLLSVGVTIILVSFSVPGIPNGSMFVMIPALMASGLPPEGIGILIGIDTVPDMFRTTANVSGDMTVAALLGRLRGTAGAAGSGGSVDAPPAAPA